MAQVGNLRRFVQRSDKAAGGLTAPKKKLDTSGAAEGILTIGPGPKYGSFWDSLSDESGVPPWVEQPDNAGDLIFLRSGLFNLVSWGYDFRGDVVAGTTYRLFLRHVKPNGGSVSEAFNWLEAPATTADQATAKRVTASLTNADVASSTRFFNKGERVRLFAPNAPAGATSGMEFYVHPLAFAD